MINDLMDSVGGMLSFCMSTLGAVSVVGVGCYHAFGDSASGDLVYEESPLLVQVQELVVAQQPLVEEVKSLCREVDYLQVYLDDRDCIAAGTHTTPIVLPPLSDYEAQPAPISLVAGCEHWSERDHL
jgi:hypothetical protein